MADVEDQPSISSLDIPETVRVGIDRWNIADESEEPQRKAILLAKNFRAGNQWDDAARIQRQGGPSIQGVAAQPSRPCLTIDRISAPVRHVSNAIKNANITATVKPNGQGASQDEADILKDWMRRVQNDARAEAPVDWAADQAAEGGIGWFRLRTDYIDEAIGPSMFDQDAKLERIANNLSVYCDPSSTHPTRRTAQWLHVTNDLAKDEYRRRWPKSKMASLDNFQGTGNSTTWVTQTLIRVSEYWHVEYKPLRVVQLKDGSILHGENIPEGLKKDQIQHERLLQQPTYVCSIINAVEVLEEYTWPGSRIPIFPIVGEELNVDGKVVLRGVIGPAIDAQRMLNWAYSAAIETAALEPKSPWIAPSAAIAAYKAMWQTANTVNYSALYWDQYDDSGKENAAPFRIPAGANISAFVELMVRSEEAVKSTTNVFDASLGKTNAQEKSGRAIQALQSQSEHANSNFLSNAQMTVLDLATEMVIIAPKILDRPGRVLSVLGIDDDTRNVMLKQPHTVGPDQQPVPLMKDGRPMSPEEMGELEAGMAKFYDISKGRYSVTVSTGKNPITRRQEAADTLGQLIPNLPPPMAAALTPPFIRSLDFSESEEMADIAQKTLPPELQPQDENQQIPPQVQAQMKAMQGIVQQLQSELQQANSGIPAKQLEVQGRLQQAQLDTDAKLTIEREKIASSERIAAMENQTKLLIADKQLTVQGAKVMAEIDRTLADQQAEAHAQGRDHTHDVGMAALEHAHELEQLDKSHEQAVDISAREAQDRDTK